MNSDIQGYTYGAVLNPYRVNYKVGQGVAQVQREAIVLATVDDTINYGSTQAATDLVLQMPMIRNNGVNIASGALSLQVPDGKVSGGNVRGMGAVDLQMSRTASTQVASGIRAFIAGSDGSIVSGNQSASIGGYSHTVSGNYSVNIGGDTNTVSGVRSVSLASTLSTVSGANCANIATNNSTASGNFSVVIAGANGNTNSINGKTIFACGNGYQSGIYAIGVATVDATPIVLLNSITGTASTANQCTLQNNNAIAFNIEIVARNTANGATGRWEAKGLIKRGANASTTALVGTPTITLTHGDAEAWIAVGAIAITADTTYGALAITVTGAAATTIHWLAKILTTEVI